MPKQKITKEMVVGAAFEIARNEGIDKVIVKSIAEKLGCSVQPIYSYCQNMDSLRSEVADEAKKFVQNYIAQNIDENDVFKSTGHAYVRIAKKEPHIFKLYIFKERENIASFDDLYKQEASPTMVKAISESLNISEKSAKKLHLNMLIYTIGIGSIFSVTSPGISEEEIFSKQEEAYRAFLKLALEEEKYE